MKFLSMFIFVITIFIGFVSVVNAENKNLYDMKSFYPIDEGVYQKDFKSFRDNLIKIAEDKDLEKLLNIVAKDIRISFGPENGKSAFIKYWELSPGKQSEKSDEFWSIFKRVITTGGSFYSDTSFHAPYYFSNWPEKYDAFDYVTITGSDVNLYRESGDSYQAYDTLSYKIVKIDDRRPFKFNNYEYMRIILPSGKKAYVNTLYVGSPIGYRAEFDKENGQWKMTIFIAGD